MFPEVSIPAGNILLSLYALTMLRNGVNVITLSRLLGHSDLTVLRRYLAQTDDDLREAHAKASPVDNWL